MWSQALTIALVVASGIGGFVASLSAVDSLAAARDRFYAQGHFADVFAVVKRAPESLQQRLLRGRRAWPTCRRTVERTVRIDIEGRSDPILGHLIGIDRKRAAPHEPGGAAPAAADSTKDRARRRSARGAGLRGFCHGSRPEAGRAPERTDQRQAARAGDGGHRAVARVHLRRAVGHARPCAASASSGSTTRRSPRPTTCMAPSTTLSIQLAPRASTSAPRSTRLRPLLAPYGGREAHGRADQTSHAMLDNEIKEQRVLGTVLPVDLSGGGRLPAQRGGVAPGGHPARADRRAQGRWATRNRTIAAHYLKLVLLIVAVGLVLGIAVGDWLGALLTGLYAEFFRFPALRAPHRTVAAWWPACGITVVTAVVGTSNAIVATVRLAPAEAMRPPAPGHYRRTLLERLGLGGMPPALRMILRNMERRPLRTGLAVARRRRRGGHRGTGQLLARRDRHHRRHPVQAGAARRRHDVDGGGDRRRRRPRAGAPARRHGGRVGALRAGDLRARPPPRAQPDPRLSRPCPSCTA